MNNGVYLLGFQFEIAMTLCQSNLLGGDLFGQALDGQLTLLDRVVVHVRGGIADDIAQVEIHRGRRRSRGFVFVRAEQNLIFAKQFLQLNSESE